MPNPRRRAEHYFSTQPAARSQPGTVRLVLPDISLDLSVDRGVFSGSGIDAGTKLLLNEGPMPATLSGDVLDLGCGYGPIAVTIAKRAPSSVVWAVDVNERALGLTRDNAEAAGVASRVRAVHPDEVPADVRFRAIYANPPIRIGKAPLHALLTTWLRRLDREGAAYLVVHKHLGSDSLAAWLASEGYGVVRLVSRMGYRLLQVMPEDARDR